LKSTVEKSSYVDRLPKKSGHGALLCQSSFCGLPLPLPAGWFESTKKRAAGSGLLLNKV